MVAESLIILQCTMTMNATLGAIDGNGVDSYCSDMGHECPDGRDCLYGMRSIPARQVFGVRLKSTLAQMGS